VEEVVIVSAVRTAIGSFNGALSSKSAVELGSIVLKAALERAEIDGSDVDEVIMGNVLQAGLGQNPARQAALKAEIPIDVPSYSVNKVCGSGLKSVILGAQSIQCGDADTVLAGGMESMSNAPFVLESKARWGYRMGHGRVVDVMLHDGLWCAMNDYHMGITAENIAKKYLISRDEQDATAANSQQKALRAISEGNFRSEIVPVTIKGKKDVIFDVDEFPKPDSTMESLAKLRPAFDKANGTVTAGNSSGINDGAAAVLLMSKKKAESMRLAPLAKIIGYGSAGVDPALMGMGPVMATQKALASSGMSLDQIDLIEANEAFAAQILAVGRELKFDMERVNVNGGAIALGHPIGASGTRIVVTLIHALKQRTAKKGLATLCIGGGQGISLLIESMA